MRRFQDPKSSSADAVRAEGHKMQPVYTAEVQPVAENDVLNVLLNTIRGAVGDANYRNWFESKAGIQLDDQRLTITVNS